MLTASDGRRDYATLEVSDRLISVGAATGDAEGKILFSQDLNPRQFVGTNLEVEAALWDRYRLKKITFYYCTNTAKTEGGSFVAGFDPDVQDINGYAIGNTIPLRAFCAHPSVHQTAVYDNESWTYSAPPDLPFLYTRDSTSTSSSIAGYTTSHWTSPGIFALCVNAAPSVTHTGHGVLWFDAVYEFNGRNVEGNIQEFGAWTYTNSGSAAATPLAGVTVFPFRTGVISSAEQPNVVNTSRLEWLHLDSDKAYYFRYYVDGGTTCSVAATAVVDTYGTSVGTSNSFSATATVTELLARPSSAGRLRIQLNQGTWAAYPTTGSFYLTSVTSANTNILVTV